MLIWISISVNSERVFGESYIKCYSYRLTVTLKCTVAYFTLNLLNYPLNHIRR